MITPDIIARTKKSVILPYLLIIISALLFSFSQPLFSLWPFVFTGLIPFFFSLDSARSYREAFIQSALWAAVHTIVISYWIFYATMGQFQKNFITSLFFYIIAVMLPMMAFYGLFGLLYRFLYRKNVFFYSLIIPSLWIIVDLGREIIPFSIPWGFAGYSTYPLENYRLTASLGGIYLLTFCAAAINGLVYFILRQFCYNRLHAGAANNNSVSRKYISNLNMMTLLPAVLILAGYIFIPAAYGYIYKKSVINNHINKQSQTQYVKIVQGNFGLKERWLSSNFINRMTTYLNLSRQNLPPGKILIIWPETVLNAEKLINDDLYRHFIATLGRSATIISGGIRSGNNQQSYNSAYCISGNGMISWYDKTILLPYSENVPGIDVLGRFYEAPASFAAGSNEPVLDTPMGRAGLSICFEVVYNRLINRSIDLGARYLVNISNDTWFGDSAMPVLHLHAAAFRAIETKRYMLRASNSGISAIIDPAGNSIKETQLFTQTSIQGNFSAIDEKTVYSTFGNWIFLIAMLSVLIPLLQIIFITAKEK